MTRRTSMPWCSSTKGLGWSPTSCSVISMRSKSTCRWRPSSMTSHRSGPWCSSSPLHGRHRGTRVQAHLAGRRRLGEHLWTPGLAHGSIGPHTAKAGPLRHEAVHVGIADVIVRLGLELRLPLRELMLQRPAVDDEVMVLPEVTLG